MSTEGGRTDGQEATWDELEFYDEFLERPADRAGEGEVCCRECGEAFGAEALAGHLGAAHSMSLDAYRSAYPGAPTEPPELGGGFWSGT